MSGIQRLFGIVLMVTGIVVAVHTVVEPLYHVSSEELPYSPLWTHINRLMLLSIVLGVIYSYIRIKGAGGAGGAGPVTREYLAASVQLYGFLFVGILFLWNWFQLSNPEYSVIGADVHSLVWAFIDAALPLLTVTLGLHLWRVTGKSR